ncbi:MAG: helix-turn-helix domain-containing protein [Coriobacteriales bacterium]
MRVKPCARREGGAGNSQPGGCKVNAVRFSTLAAICRELHCQPGDFIEYVDE